MRPLRPFYEGRWDRPFAFLSSHHSYLVLKASRRRQWHPTLVLFPGKSHGWRGLIGCSPWGLEESDTTEWLHLHFSLSCIGEGNGNPLQYSCLENPRDGGAWWAAVYGVAQSRTRLKQLSSSSSRRLLSASRGPFLLAYAQVYRWKDCKIYQCFYTLGFSQRWK